MNSKVLFTASTFSHICSFHLPYISELKSRGYSVHVACGGEKRAIPCAEQVIRVPFVKSMFSPKNLKAAAMLRRSIKKEAYGLIITHTALASFFTRLALIGLKNRPGVINMVHGYLFDDATGFFKKKLLLTAERLTAPYTDLVLTMNRWDFEEAKRCRLGREIRFIPGVGVDFSRFPANSADGTAVRRSLNISADAFVLFYAAEFSKRKNQETLIRMLSLLPDNIELILAGSGELLESSKQLADSLGLGSRVHFPGYITEISSWYKAADAAVASSRSEGLPFNIMEAMYSSLPVIASSVKGHTDLIKDGCTGLLCPYGDSKAFAEAVMKLSSSPSLRSELAARAFENVRKYSLSAVLPEIMNYYCSFM